MVTMLGPELSEAEACHSNQDNNASSTLGQYVPLASPEINSGQTSKRVIEVQNHQSTSNEKANFSFMPVLE